MSNSHPSPPISVLLAEENMNQECRDLISSLPRRRSFVSDIVYKYHGVWLIASVLQGIHACRQHFQANDSDIFLATYPKSGTTWLKAVAFAVLNRHRYDVGGDTHNHPLLASNSHDLVLFLEFRLYLGGQKPDLSSMESPRVFATHMPFSLLPESVKSSSSKLVYMCRNPKDALVSRWHFVNKMKSESEERIPLEEAFDRYCDGVLTYGPFWEHALSYWKESLERPEKVLFLKYEEMKEQPSAQVRRLAKFLGCPFSHEEEACGVVDEIVKMCSFEYLSNLEVNKTGRRWFGMKNELFFRQGEVGDWKNYLTADMAARLDKICEEKLDGSGLKF